MKIVPAHYALFSGCAVERPGSSARRATIALAKVLGFELWEAPGRGCCGARVDRPSDKAALRDLTAPLVEATNQGLAIACLSPGCRQVIAAQLRSATQGLPAAEPDAAPPRVLDSVQVLTQEDDPDRLAHALVRSMSPLRVGLHANCHGDHIPALSATAPRRPDPVGWSAATPAANGPAGSAPVPPVEALAGLIAVTGAEPSAEVSGEGRCAKTPLLPMPTDRRVEAPGCLTVATRSGVDVVVTPCFLCFGTLNERQRRLSRDDPARAIPVLHLAQFLGMACGVAPADLELGRITARAQHILAPFTV